MDADGKLAGVHSATHSNIHVGINIFRHSKWIRQTQKELMKNPDQIKSVQDMLEDIDNHILLSKFHLQ